MSQLSRVIDFTSRIRSTFGNSIIVGLVMGTIGGFSLSLMLQAQCHASWVAIIRRWQDLISGLLALLVGSVTISLLWLQIWNEKQRHVNALTRKKWASIAYMHDALVDLSAWLSDCFVFLDGKSQTFPKPPSDAMKVFKDAIEYVDQPSSLMLKKLVSRYQVYNSRMSDFARRKRLADQGIKPVPIGSRDQRIADTIEMSHRVHSMFEYARDDASEIPSEQPSKELLYNAVSNLVGVDEFWQMSTAYRYLYPIVDQLYDELPARYR